MPPNSMHDGQAGQPLGPGPGARLLAAQVVFRHGARTPISTAFYNATEWTCSEEYPGIALDIRGASGGPAPPVVDPDSPELPGGCPQGTLTERGYEMALQLGRQLRERYAKRLGLLPGEYRPGAVYAHTTTYRRTIATLKGVLTGLLPEGAGSDPFPANATDERHTFFYPSNRSCPALGPIIGRLSKTALEREASGPQRPAERTRAALGLPDDGAPLQWWRLRDVLSCMLAERPGERPVGLVDELYDLIDRRATEWETSIYAPGPWNCDAPAHDCRDVIRLSVGPLVWRVLRNMDRAAAEAVGGAAGRGTASCSGAQPAQPAAGEGGIWNGSGSKSGGGASGAASGGPGGWGDAGEAGGAGRGGAAAAAAAPRLFLYSGHDTTVMPLLAALGVEMRKWAPFVSNVAFELWAERDGGRPWVRVLYMGQPLPLFEHDHHHHHLHASGDARQHNRLARGLEGAALAAQDAQQQHEPPHWRRAHQELADQQQQQQQQHQQLQEQDHENHQQQQQQQQGADAVSSDNGGGGGSVGWIELDELRHRLHRVSINDKEKSDACWPQPQAAAA